MCQSVSNKWVLIPDIMAMSLYKIIQILVDYEQHPIINFWLKLYVIVCIFNKMKISRI